MKKQPEKKIKTKLKVGDLVKVISGKWKKTIDNIVKLDLRKQLAYLNSVSKNVFDKKKNKKATVVKENEQDKKKEVVLVKKMIPIHISNINIWLEKEQRTTRVKLEKNLQKN